MLMICGRITHSPIVVHHQVEVVVLAGVIEFGVTAEAALYHAERLLDGLLQLPCLDRWLHAFAGADEKLVVEHYSQAGQGVY